LRVNITGYGRLEGCKLALYAPPYFIDARQSYVRHSVGVSEGKSDITHGHVKTDLSDSGGVLILSSGGIKPPHWEHVSQFFDISPPGDDKRVDVILSEMSTPLAPVTYNLMVQKKVRPGVYSLPLYLTYSDGFSWNTDEYTAEIVVPNWFQRHQLLVWILGTLIAVVLGLAQIASAVYPLLGGPPPSIQSTPAESPRTAVPIPPEPPGSMAPTPPNKRSGSDSDPSPFTLASANEVSLMEVPGKGKRSSHSRCLR
jgi:hypothetical protein